MKSESFVSSFSFLGKREYVQGGILLDFCLNCIWQGSDSAEDIGVEQLKIYKEVNRNVRFVRCRDGEGERVAEISYILDGKRCAAFLALTESPISMRTPDAVASVELLRWDDHFSGEGSVFGIRNFKDVIEGAVEVNKRLHLLSPAVNATEPRVRVVLLKDFVAWRSIGADKMTVAIRLTGERSYGGLHYTLSDVSLSAGDLLGKMKVCFSSNGAGK